LLLPSQAIEVQIYDRRNILIDEIEFEGHFEGFALCEDGVEQVIGDVCLAERCAGCAGEDAEVALCGGLG
jgi:hypothetical protein